MDFSRGPDGEPRQQFQHAATSASAFTNPTPPSGGAGENGPPAQHADDPQVILSAKFGGHQTLILA